MEIVKDERVKKIIEKIKEATRLTKLNGEIYLTGGCIRDSLLGLPIKDLDFAVNVKDGAIMVASMLAAREKCYVTATNPVVFPSYGTAKVSLFNDKELKDINIEFVDTRKCSRDIYNPTKDYFGTIEEDSKRRDLSINALYWNITNGKLYDYNGGVDDMVTQTLRCPDPYKIFIEDPIKMLRVIRFSAELGWGIEKDTWLAMIQNAKWIKSVAQEKITMEVAKILTSPNPSVGIRKMLYCGLLQRVMPDIQELTTAYESRNPMVTAFDHTMKVLDTVQPILENRLAALFHDIGSVVSDNYNRSVSKDMFSADIAASDLKEMRFSNGVINIVSTAIRYHRVFTNYADGVMPPDKKIRKFVNLCGRDIATVLDLMNANNIHCTYGKKKTQVLSIAKRMEELDKIEEVKNVKLPINGGDIMKHLHIKGSPIVGILLDKVKDAYFENPKITREECFKLVEEEAKVLAV